MNRKVQPPYALPRIDAAGAIAELGIKVPVTFEHRCLNGFEGPTFRALFGGNVMYGCTTMSPERLGIVALDMEALALPGAPTIASTVAHELVHIAQAERAGSLTEAAEQYQSETESNGYWFNAFEVEARELEVALEPKVVVTHETRDEGPQDAEDEQ